MGGPATSHGFGPRVTPQLRLEREYRPVSPLDLNDRRGRGSAAQEEISLFSPSINAKEPAAAKSGRIFAFHAFG
jgi:hypothetical protein